jgi:hypothetical protein
MSRNCVLPVCQILLQFSHRSNSLQVKYRNNYTLVPQIIKQLYTAIDRDIRMIDNGAAMVYSTQDGVFQDDVERRLQSRTNAGGDFVSPQTGSRAVIHDRPMKRIHILER